MSDLEAIAQAIAARFSAANVTPPTGYDNIRSSTEQLPNQIGATPCVLVFPPVEESIAGNGLLQITQTWTVRLYLTKWGDLPRQMTVAYKWRNALYLQLKGQVYLGQAATGSAGASITRMEIAAFDYAEVRYDGIELTIVNNVREGYSAVA